MYYISTGTTFMHRRNEHFCVFISLRKQLDMDMETITNFGFICLGTYFLVKIWRNIFTFYVGTWEWILLFLANDKVYASKNSAVMSWIISIWCCFKSVDYIKTMTDIWFICPGTYLLMTQGRNIFILLRIELILLYFARNRY